MDADARLRLLGYYEDRTPTYGYEATREAAMAAFAKTWRREPDLLCEGALAKLRGHLYSD
jgi:hypothetical protein